MLGAMAAGEIEHKVERQKRTSDQLAAAGKPHPGLGRFGYGVDQMTIRESELVRDADTALYRAKRCRCAVAP